MSTQKWPSVTPVHISKDISTSTITSTLDANNPLPQLLHTPSGLAILELQGTINFPTVTAPEEPSSDTNASTEVGRLVFPHYTEGISDPKGGAWMKKVYFYIGRHQRMTGEIKKLAKPLAVLRKKEGGEEEDAVEVVEIVRYKILFGSRPEPVSED